MVSATIFMALIAIIGTALNFWLTTKSGKRWLNELKGEA